MSNRLECSPQFLGGSHTRDHLKAFDHLKHVTDCSSQGAFAPPKLPKGVKLLNGCRIV